MRKAWVVWAAVLILLCSAGGALAAQEAVKGPHLLFGPRLGASWVVIDPNAWNAALQAAFADPKKYYFPIFTEMGLQAQQLVPLGDSKNSLSFQEMLLLSDLDQTAPFVSVNATIGYRTGAGLEAGLGPFISTSAPSGTIQLTATVVYTLGWTLPAKGFAVPVTLMFVPLPSYQNPRVSLLFGFLFDVLE